jgi:membrane associated rhomboid family serine protease
MHLLGNMWFLWIFGNNIEDSMTRPRFVVFYLVCGLAAAMMQVLSGPSSAVPMVGASGAISGVMGAYVLLYPHVRVWTWFGFFFFPVPAWAMLIWWFFLQLAGGFSQEGTTGGTAFWAHVGGFVAGLLLVRFFVVPRNIQLRRQALYEPY